MNEKEKEILERYQAWKLYLDEKKVSSREHNLYYEDGAFCKTCGTCGACTGCGGCSSCG